MPKITIPSGNRTLTGSFHHNNLYFFLSQRTVETPIKCRTMHFIWVFTVYQNTHIGAFCYIVNNWSRNFYTLKI